MEKRDRKESLLKTFEGQIFQSTLDYIVGLGLEIRENTKTPVLSPEEDIVEKMQDEQKVEENFQQEEKELSLTVDRTDFKIDLLFIGEVPADFVEGETNDLLSKMITALNLAPEKTETLLLNREDENSLALIQSKMKECSPHAMVTLGAYATNLLLDKKTKLSKVHGKEQKYIYEEKNYSFFPVFHPDYLNINPNMKRTAWNDLKLVLEFLSK
jgi:uracil-DNA glycosylase family 4